MFALPRPCTLTPPKFFAERPRARWAAVVLTVTALAGLLLLVEPASASDRRDQDRARAALMAGEVMPLAAVLDRLQRTHPGQVLEVELERDDGRWIYEIKLLQANGRLLKIELDARTAALIEVRQRNGERTRSDKGSSR